MTRKKEPFLERKSRVNMFICGPTVYDYIHIGNARTYVFFDVFAKWLRHSGYDLTYLMNITDLDDKIIARAHESGEDVNQFAKQYENAFLKDVESLGITSVDKYPRATGHIEEIKKQIQILLEKQNAYIIDKEGVYFDLTTFPHYGNLAGRTIEMAEDGVSRIDVCEGKRNKGDFAIWKFSKTDEPSWSASFGDGRPGWHIEDTAMSEKEFGPQYDLHGAGIDLMFPHHEAEIALMESQSDKSPFVKYWIHGGFLTINKERMGKSKGNFITAREALEKYSPQALRFFFLSAHYRSPLDYSDMSLQSAEAAIARISDFDNRLDSYVGNGSKSIDTKEVQLKIKEFLDDDVNLPGAFSHLFDLIRNVNPMLQHNDISTRSATDIKSLLDKCDDMFGIIRKTHSDIPEDIQSFVNQREEARKIKDFSESDNLRKKIEALGFSIDDTPYGPYVRKVV